MRKSDYWCYFPGETPKICPICGKEINPISISADNKIIHCSVGINDDGTMCHWECAEKGCCVQAKH